MDLPASRPSHSEGPQRAVKREPANRSAVRAALKQALFGAALLAVAVPMTVHFAVVGGRGAAPADVPAERSPSVDIAELQGKVDQLYALELDRARRTAMAAVAKPPELSGATAAPAPTRPSGAEMQRRIETQHRISDWKALRLAEAVEAEPTDQSWSAGVSATVRSVMSSNSLNGSIVERVDCRTTLCQMSFVHTDELSQQILQQELPLSVPALGRSMMMTTHGSDGKIHTLAFFSKAGHPLPDPVPPRELLSD